MTRLTGRVGKLETPRTRRPARSGEEEEESRLRKTMRYLNTLERPEAKKGSRETPDEVDVAEVKVNKEKDESQTEDEPQFEEEGGHLDPAQVCQGRALKKCWGWSSSHRGMVRRQKRRRTDHDEADRSSEERRRREIIREMPTCCMWIQNETRGTQRRLVS